MTDLNTDVQASLKVAGDQSMSEQYRNAMLSAGINPDEVVTAPDPGPTSDPISLESLVDQESTQQGVRRQSLPMRLINWYTQDGGGKYQGYKSFMLIDVWHPEKGRVLVTHSYERSDGSVTPLGMWLRDHMKRGDVFQVGEIATNKGYTVYRPIQVK